MGKQVAERGLVQNISKYACLFTRMEGHAQEINYNLHVQKCGADTFVKTNKIAFIGKLRPD
jgi:hypothetical protein